MDRDELNIQTAKISWKELEIFFAKGSAIYVSSKLDLIDVGLEIFLDNKIKIKQWISDDMVSKVSDYQAEAWTNSDATLWSLVIKPWVLVQPLKFTSFHGENKN